MRIASWNVNSVRIRLESLRRFVRKYQPDVLCLQEIKVTDDLFPDEALRRMGFEGAAVVGQAGYNGVATFSRQPFTRVWAEEISSSGEARHVAAVLEGGMEIHNLYVPAGGPIADVDQNPAFAAKLRFMRSFARIMEGWPQRESRDRILVGDLNVAPLPTDVWSHRKLRRVVTHTQVEIEHLTLMQDAIGWIDLAREVVPPIRKLFTWWSYRTPDWQRQDKGRRLDHIWLSPSLQDVAADFQVAREVRGWKRPSDHAPIMAELGALRGRAEAP